MNNYDVIVYIGRFQPPHLAHIETIKQALKQSSNVVVLVGSATQPRTTKNPFTWDERAEMIKASVPQEYVDSLVVAPIRDKKYNDPQWVKQVQEIVQIFANADQTVGIIGHSKDETSYYLSMFPQWESIEVDNINDMHATDIRDSYFSTDEEDFDLHVAPKLPQPIHDWMKAFMLRPEYEQLVKEHEFIATYKSAWKHAPYEPTFVTVDAVVIQSGHILLIRRRAEPGKGLFAIPGGFVNSTERLEDAAIRELKEETKLKVPEAVLRGSIRTSFVADDPTRSLRGRTISHVYGIMLNSGKLPKVKGSDDADKAVWVPLSTFDRMENQMFEDHYHLVQTVVNGMIK